MQSKEFHDDTNKTRMERLLSLGFEINNKFDSKRNDEDGGEESITREEGREIEEVMNL